MPTTSEAMCHHPLCPFTLFIYFEPKMSLKRYNALFMWVCVFTLRAKFCTKRVYDSYTQCISYPAKPVNTLFNLHSISTKVTHEKNECKFKFYHPFGAILDPISGVFYASPKTLHLHQYLVHRTLLNGADVSFRKQGPLFRGIVCAYLIRLQVRMIQAPLPRT